MRSQLNIPARIDQINKKHQGNFCLRVLAETRYAFEVSKIDGGKWDTYIDDALDVLEESMRLEGVITDSAAHEAEKKLVPVSSAAKRYTVLFVGHAHIDMNWLWRYDETVSITLETFRTVLQLLEEYPQFRFSQSQASVYEIVEQYDKNLLNDIRKYISQGRWEVTASTWVEADRNMPSGESMARHILYTRSYLTKLLDIEPDSLRLDFEPDTFGHGIMTPEILSQGGVKYYYHCRGYEEETLYRWRSPSGAEILCYRDPFWYLGPVEPDNVLGAPSFCQKYGLDTQLRVYGVGDHGGGPTRRDITRLIDMSNWPVFPTVRFGSYNEFFTQAEKAQNLPVINSELNPIFTGCYTSQSRIKVGNRFSEYKLDEAERFSVQASILTGLDYKRDVFENAWRKVLFNQFHDILPGSGIIDTREYALGQYAQVYAASDTQKLRALRNMGGQVDTSAWIEMNDITQSTSEGAGVGYGIKHEIGISQTERGRGINRVFHIFNPSAVERSEVLELVIFDWPGDYRYIKLMDVNGQELEHQVLDMEPQHYWQHEFKRVLIDVRIPACGLVTCICTQDLNKDIPKQADNSPRVEKVQSFILENEFVRAEFSTETGALVSFIDKEKNFELLDGPSAFFRIIDEQPATNTAGTAWTVGRYRAIENLTKDVQVSQDHGGPLKNEIIISTHARSSKVVYTVSLSKNSPWLNFDCQVDWREFGVPGERTQQLNFTLPSIFFKSGFIHDVPGGLIEREPSAQDMPSQSFSAVISTSDKAIMLISNSSYGFRCETNQKNNLATMSLNCIRSSSDPDPYPECGIHNFRIGIGISNNDGIELLNTSYNFCHPLSYISDHPRKNTNIVPAERIKVSGAFLQSVKLAECGQDIILRIICGPERNAEIKVTLWAEPESATIVDIHENSYANNQSIKCEENSLYFATRPNGTISLRVKLKESDEVFFDD